MAAVGIESKHVGWLADPITADAHCIMAPAAAHSKEVAPPAITAEALTHKFIYLLSHLTGLSLSNNFNTSNTSFLLGFSKLSFKSKIKNQNKYESKKKIADFRKKALANCPQLMNISFLNFINIFVTYLRIEDIEDKSNKRVVFLMKILQSSRKHIFVTCLDWWQQKELKWMAVTDFKM